VDDRTRVVFSTAVGAALGGIVGYLYLTDAGQRVRQQIEPKLDDFAREIRRFRSTVDKARATANEGWRSLSEIVGESGGRSAWGGGGLGDLSH
jgi:hypothetical protein